MDVQINGGTAASGNRSSGCHDGSGLVVMVVEEAVVAVTQAVVVAVMVAEVTTLLAVAVMVAVTVVEGAVVKVKVVLGSPEGWRWW